MSFLSLARQPRGSSSSRAAGLLYARFELLRALRSRRYFLFSLGFPIVLYFVIASPQRHVHNLGGTGVSAPLYYMASLASFGTMMSMMSSGARIAGERQVGWTRQLRITPLSPRAYIRAKVLVAYAMAGITIATLYISGAALGVSMPAGTWLKMTGLIIIGLLPFAALGITLGHLMNVDSIGPVTGGTVSLLALVSGTWFPVTHGFLHDVGQCLPSYWLAQVRDVAENGHSWGATGWLVVLGWTVALTITARIAYKRDTGRA